MSWCIQNTAICLAFFSLSLSHHDFAIGCIFYVLDGPSNTTRLDNDSCLHMQYFHFFLVESQYSCSKVKESFSMLEFTDHKIPRSYLFFVRKWSSTNWIKTILAQNFQTSSGGGIDNRVRRYWTGNTERNHIPIYQTQGRPHSYQICLGCRILPLYEKSMKERCMPMHYWKCERFREIMYQK